MLKHYQISYKYSRDGKVWTHTTETVKGESDVSVMIQIQSRHPYVKDIRVVSVK